MLDPFQLSETEPYATTSTMARLGMFAYVGEWRDGTYASIELSDGMHTLVGLPAGTPHDLAGEWELCLHSDDRERYAAGYRYMQFPDGGPAETTYRLVGHDGVTRVVRDTYAWETVRPGLTIVRGVVQELSGMREVARDLEATRHWFEREAAAAGEAVFSSEWAGDRWEMLYVGPGFERLIGGVIPGARITEAFENAVHPDDREAWWGVDHALHHGEAITLTYRLCGLDGIERWVEERTRPRREGDRLLVDGILFDVTASRRRERQLADAQAALERIAAFAEEVFYRYDWPAGEPGQMIVALPPLGSLYGGPEIGDTEMAARWRELVHPDDVGRYDLANSCLRDEGSFDIEYRIRDLEGVTRWVHQREQARPSAGGHEVDGVLADITRRKRAEAQREIALREAERRARIDHLTGLSNRRRFAELLEAQLARADRDGCTPGLIALDLDNFKSLNDAFGHRGGDEVLVELARRLGAHAPADAMVGRWGGEEFVVLVPHTDSAAELRALAERLRTGLATDPYVVAGETARLALSAGSVRADGDGWSIDTLFDAADAALYAAKRRGRNTTVGYCELGDRDLGADRSEAALLASAFARCAAHRANTDADDPGETAELSARVAERLGLGARQVLRARVGGWLHDIGELGLRDEILARPGVLEESDWLAIRRHPEIGAELVRGIPAVADAAGVVHHHHERVDGAGYPDGLAGEAIPIEARIVAAVDAYTAMRRERPYRTALTQGEAVAELRRVSGSQLDIAVVEALIALVG